MKGIFGTGPRKYFLIAGVVVLLDQLVKLWVKLGMVPGEEIRVLGNLFKIHFIENKGAAFGLTVTKIAGFFGAEISDETGKVILSVFSILAVIAIGYVLFRLARHRSPLPFYVALIFGGALGNIIDRTFYGMIFESINNYDGGLFFGRVVDMFYLDIGDMPLPGGGSYHLWPIFNIADTAITVGILVLLFFQGKYFKMDEAARKDEAGESESTETMESNSPAADSKASKMGLNGQGEQSPEAPSPLETGQPQEDDRPTD